MAAYDQLAAIAKAKGKRPDQVTITDLTGSGMDFGAAQTAIMGAAGALTKAPPKAAPAYVPAGPVPDSQKLGADLMSRAIAMGMTNPANIQQNATQQKIDMGKQFGSNPITGVYNPVSGLGAAAKDAVKPPTAPATQPVVPPSAPSGDGVTPGTVVPPTAPPAPPAAPPVAPPPTAPTTITPRATSATVQAIMDQLTAKTKALPRTAEEIMSGPEYQMLKKANDLKRARAQLAIRQQMSSRNMLRSTPAIQALAGSDAQYEAEDTQNALKSIEVADARRRQEIADINTLLKTQMDVENTGFDQGYKDFTATAPYNYETASSLANRADRKEEAAYGKERDVKADARLEKQDKRVANEDALKSATTRAAYTGSLFLPEDQPILDEAISAKGEYEVLRAQGVPADDPRLVALSLKANTARAKLGSLGYGDVDSLIGSGITAAQARANAGKIGYTPRPDPKAKAELTKAQAEAELAQAKVEELQLKNIAAADPGSTESRKAELELQEVQARIKQLEASATASYASANKSNKEADNVGKDDKETPDEKRFWEQFQNRVDNHTREYGVDPGAAEVWEEYRTVLTDGNPKTGKPYTRDEAAEEFQTMKAQTGLTRLGETWLNYMWASSMGDSDASATLKRFRDDAQK